jgi:hypothetical protein
LKGIVLTSRLGEFLLLKAVFANGREARATSTRRPSGRRGDKEQAGQRWPRGTAIYQDVSHNPGRLAKRCAAVNRRSKFNPAAILLDTLLHPPLHPPAASMEG